jgi:hypothetical protein
MKRRKIQVRTYTGEQIHAMELEKIAAMTPKQRLQYVCHLQANLAYLRGAQRRSLSGDVTRKQAERGLASASEMQSHFQNARKWLLEEIEACHSNDHQTSHRN